MLRKQFFSLFAIGIFSLVFSITMDAQPLHHTNSDLPCINKNYNLLAHIAVDSMDREPLYSQESLDSIIMKLNEHFSPICVSFSLCEYNILEKDYSLGRISNQPITRNQRLLELKTRFSLRRRINIFFLDRIDEVHCGTSTFEGILTTNDANIYTELTCADDIPEQIAHHLGHIFGLRNTYDSATIELVDGSNCDSTGDLICDTPADPYDQTYVTPEEIDLINQGKLVTTFVNQSCEFVYEIKDPNGQYYQPDVGNIMSRYPCKCGFTQGQYRLMAETILQSTIRHF